MTDERIFFVRVLNCQTKACVNNANKWYWDVSGQKIPLQDFQLTAVPGGLSIDSSGICVRLITDSNVMSDYGCNTDFRVICEFDQELSPTSKPPSGIKLVL